MQYIASQLQCVCCVFLGTKQQSKSPSVDVLLRSVLLLLACLLRSSGSAEGWYNGTAANLASHPASWQTLQQH
jgi:hypothetical protein